MRKSSKKFNRQKILLIVIVIFSVFLFFIIRSIENRIDPKIRKICTYYCKSQVTQMLNESVEEVINENNIQYSDLAVREFDNDTVNSYEIRTENVNKIQSQIVKKANDKLKMKSNNTISIPIGSAGKSYFFNAKGPEIKVKFLPESTILTELKSEFSSAGINQTCHTISLDITAEAIAILPSENIEIHVDLNCILAESIIIGNVPDSMWLRQ